MGKHVMHLDPSLPLPPELGAVIIAIGVLVLLVIGYDAYRYARNSDG